MGPAWDCRLAAPSSNRMAAAYGLPTTVRGARAFISFYPQRRIGSAGASIVTKCHHVRNWHFSDIPSARTNPDVIGCPGVGLGPSFFERSISAALVRK